MPHDFEEILSEGARAYAELECESVSSRGVWFTMDKILHGSAYNDADCLGDKLISLETRAAYYVEYDRFMASRGQAGNIEVESPRKRLSVYDAHLAEINQAAANEQQRLLIFLAFLCKTFGLFLCRETLDKDFVFLAHCELWDSLIQKDPWLSLAEQDTVKNILVMAPRGAYKSSASSVNVAQHILAHPDIRVKILTATLELAESFCREVRNYFMPADMENITVFQAIFASDVRLEKAGRPRVTFLITDTGKENQFTCPARSVYKKEPTLSATSIGKAKAGDHLDLLVFDDAISENNSATIQLIAKTNLKIGMSSKLVDPGMYRLFFGTSYSPEDHYAVIRANPEDFRILIRPAKELKKDLSGNTAIQRGKIKADLEIIDWKLLFQVDKHGAEKLSGRILDAFERSDPENFGGQYLLNPHGIKQIVFSEALMQARIIPRDRMPLGKYATYMLIDTADSVQSYSDNSVISVLEIHSVTQTGYITEIVRGKFIPSDLCYQIAFLAHKTKPLRVLIEDAKGANHLRETIERISRDLGDGHIPLEFVKVDNRKGSKMSRILKLEPILQSGRLFFLDNISCIEDLISEFCNLGSARNDDIPDCVALSQNVLSDARVGPEDPYQTELADRLLRGKEFSDMIFNASPETYIDKPIEPMDLNENQGEELWDPFGY